MLAVWAASLAMAATAYAQSSSIDPAIADPTLTPRGGWTISPSVAYGGNYDDNVLIQESGDNTQGDFQNAINPTLSAVFNGRRSEFDASYSGSFIRYVDLSSLNSFDQHMSASFRRALTRHTSFFATQSFTSSPTTELSELVGVPFLRVGSRVEDMRGGFDMDVTKRTFISASYSFQLIDFDADPTSGTSLLGGHSHGGSFSWKRSMTERIAMTVDYNLQHAIVIGTDGFNVHNAYGGVEYRTSPSITVAGSFGLSHLGILGQPEPSRTGPAYRADYSQTFERAQFHADYSRSYVPSYSFGGTQQNEEAAGQLSVPITPRVYLQSSLAWRRNEPLDIGGDRLKSVLTGTTIGYLVAPWLSVEGFYDGSFQNVQRPGGRLNRNRFGFQIVTTKPMRIR